MAEGQVGLRREHLQEWAPWTKLFTAFRVALDPKKLILAAAGIFAMAFGWWFLSLIFHDVFRSTPPSWAAYKTSYGVSDTEPDDPAEQTSQKEKLQNAWRAFKTDLNSWNLMHKLAGPVPNNAKEAVPYDEADFTDTPTQYEEVKTAIEDVKEKTSKRRQKVTVVTRPEDNKQHLKVGSRAIDVQRGRNVSPAAVTSLSNRITAQQLYEKYNKDTHEVHIENVTFTVTDLNAWKRFTEDLQSSKTLAMIDEELRAGDKSWTNPEATRAALSFLKKKDANLYKPAGYLRTMPWYEDRGPNPFLVVAGMAGERNVPWTRGEMLEWLLRDQVPVLLEPLVKFLSPVIYLFHPAADIWIRIYLLLVLAWTLVVWSIIGGAITRMAAVEVARPNERVSLKEAVRFSCTRFSSYLSAQLIPLGFLALLALFLFVYGFVEVLIPIIGDVLIGGLLFPIGLLVGLIMAVLVVGLVGWPLMHATISSEGSDSFDALSRSYSYVYQSPWHYLWYWFIALVYGAALIFFVGLMGSLTIYLAKWGMSFMVPNWGYLAARDPAYLFIETPTSYGWRDLLLINSPDAVTVPIFHRDGAVVPGYTLSTAISNPTGLFPWNYLGAWLVAFWTILLFLLVIGFGYSYFWTASTIIYLLMRRKVDDTDMDEIHLEEEIEAPHMPMQPTAPAAATPAARPGTVPLNVVESPPGRPTPAPTPGSLTPAAVPATPAAAPPPAASPGPAALATPAAPTPERHTEPARTEPTSTEAEHRSVPDETTGRGSDGNRPHREDTDTETSSPGSSS